MCGIAGVLSLGEHLSDRDIRDVDSMTRILRHRGPDHTGFQHGDTWSLGSTRLKIIDLSDDANLPASNEDGSVWITYNGEVTNFLALEREFSLRKKHRFRSKSDSEVLVHLYEELGIDFVQQLSGMFAFCLVDTRIGRAWVVRDFYGIRPLFYMTAGDRLYFASEIKSFLNLDRFDGRIDREALYHYFSLAYIPDRMTPFEQVRELQGGCLLEVDLERGRFEEKEYYEVRYDPDEAMTEKEAAAGLRERMIDSVERNLISDAPLGLTLSGGFDTSSMLSILKLLGRSRDVHTFSIRIDEPSFDESAFQKIMVDFAGSKHHEVTIRPDVVEDNLIRHMAFMDEPTGDGAAIPTWVLAEQAKDYVRVLLSGEGGDEVFNAYETHLAYRVRRMYRSLVPRPIRSVIRSAVRRLPTDYRKLSFDFLAKRFSEGAELGAPEAHFFWRHSMNAEEKRALMPRNSDFRPTESFFTDLFHSLDFADGLDRISLIDIKYFFIGDLMVKNDRMMMAHSIEARFPWMDRILMEFASSVPARIRMKRLTRRSLQKKAMRGIVPEAIHRRTNMGLEMPHSNWFLGGLKNMAQRYLDPKEIGKSGILEPRAVETMWREHLAGVKDHGRSLWCIINFQVWFDLFVHEGNYRRYLDLPDG